MRHILGPRVSIIVPCYRQAHFLEVAIESALEQRGVQVMPIVIDDGSPDDVDAVVRRFGSRVQLIRQENQGLAGARNTGLRAATGDFIAFLDADDWYFPDTLRHRIEVIEAHPEVSVTVSDWDDYQSPGGPVRESHQVPEIEADPFHVLLRRNVAPPLSYLVRRTALERVGCFTRSTPGCEDWDLWLRLAAAGHRFVRAPLGRAAYRVHSLSMSTNTPYMQRASLEVLRRHGRTHPGCHRCRVAIEQCRRELWEVYATYFSQQAGLGKSGFLQVLRGTVPLAWNEPGLGVTLARRLAFKQMKALRNRLV